MATVTALFDRFEDADRATDMLLSRGFVKDDIGILAADHVVQERRKQGTVEVTEADGASGAMGGAMVGGIGGLLAGVAALAIPGIGPAITAGTLASALGLPLVGAGAGAMAGGLIGGLVDMGVPEEDAHVYAEGVKRGGVLLSVQTGDDRVEEAREILQAASAVNLDARRAEWRQAGWSSFGEAHASRPRTEPEELTAQPVERRASADPLLEIEVDKGGT